MQLLYLQFQYGYLLVLLAIPAVLVILFLGLLRWKKKTTRRIGDPKLIKALTRSHSPKKFLIKFIMVTTALVLGVVGLANLRKPGGKGGLQRRGIDVVVALDISKSMWANDLKPTRLDRAKQLIDRLIDDMPNDRIALVCFAGKAYLQMPLTVDHDAAKLYVNTATPSALPTQGTVISDALDMSSRAFNAKEGRFKSVVLISDGEDHDANAAEKAKELASLGVMVNTVGIGSTEGSYITDPETGMIKTDAAGSRVVSKLNEEELKMIASETNGTYVHFESIDETLVALKAQLDQIEAKAFNDTSLMNYKTYYAWFIIPMLLLLIVEWLLPETKKQTKA